jgi:PAS domain S-box-containing protein
MMRAWPIRSKIPRSYTAFAYLTLFGLAISLPLLALLGTLLWHSAAVEREQLQGRVLQVLDDVVDDLDRDFDRHLTILRTLATLQSLKEENWPVFYEQAKAGLQGRAYLILIDASGRQLVNTYVPYGEQPATTGDPETLRRMQMTKAPVVSNLFTSLVVKQPVFNVSIPIIRDEQVRYVISLGLLPADLAELIAGQRFGPEWVTIIWGANGVVLARSRESERYVGTTLPARMREHDQRTIVRTTNLEGTDVLHATARSQLSGWGVGVNVPYRAISEQLRQSVLLWTAAAVAAIALASAFGLLFARPITSSLSAASRAAAAFGHGERFPITGSRLREADAFLNTLETARREIADHADALKQAEEQFRLSVEAAPNGTVLANGDGTIVVVNKQVERLFGYRRDELIGQNVDLLVPERFRAQHPTDRANYTSNPSVRLMGTGRDVFARRKDGSEFPVEIGLSPIVTAQGTMILSAIVDITARKHWEEGQQLVIRELHHRTKNLLAVTQVITNRSLEEAKTFAEARLVMNGRLRALAQAYDMLADAKWEGAPLREIIERQLAGMGSRFTIIGCDVVVTPSAAQQLAMITHELMTNALKYGALSAPHGRVSIEGKLDSEGLYRFTWKETGGPPASVPSRRGFGTVILLDSARQFSESVTADYLSTGLVYSLRIRTQDFVLGPGKLSA